ncbi:MAG: tRNA preQ1(34) S-adenosylmethionine ribosyltransferase-isomerase QueA [Eubacteriaceae bacterium]|nr:tRNA preQ1(34) S-adenosylmethionine ribosyltransferase-isomerase QueA [Eubacteriaceae bacterium]
MKPLKTDDFNYNLPEELIAQRPIEKRDTSRLMVLNRKEKTIQDRLFSDLPDLLKPGDLLVLNNTKVLPARIYGKKRDTGGKIEILLHKKLTENTWEVMVKPGRRAKVGTRIQFSEKLEGKVLALRPDGLREMRFDYSGIFEEILEEIGTMPLPPYIQETLVEQQRYQTVYAKYNGSVAAPTAGLHFTEDIFKKLQEKNIDRAEITLHVGIGTFRPVKEEYISKHQMHSESYRIDAQTAKKIEEQRQRGGRIVAVGTTSVRTLESIASKNNGRIVADSGETDIFITPGYRWQVVDALVTNFHLPKSTLLMLVAAFYDREEVLKAYRHAVEKRYRFFSFGDGMFIQ